MQKAIMNLERTLIRVLWLLMLCMAGPGICGFAGQQNGPFSPDPELRKFTSALVRVISDGREEERATAYFRVPWEPADAGTNATLLVFVMLEGRGGSNDFRDWVALVDEQKDSPPSRRYTLSDVYLIGEKMWRDVDFGKATLAGKTVVVPISKWVKGDRGCCPTGSGKIVISERDGRLVVAEK
jgi:hypothetical protein